MLRREGESLLQLGPPIVQSLILARIDQIEAHAIKGRTRDVKSRQGLGNGMKAAQPS